MDNKKQSHLNFLDGLLEQGVNHFTFAEASDKTGRSPKATTDFLNRMLDLGLIEKVRRGHYVIRQLGYLGTSSSSEDISLAVGAAFGEIIHRIGYRSALEEHELLTHPARTIQVAVSKRFHWKEISKRPLKLITEPEEKILVGAEKRGSTYISDLERTLLDATSRPDLIGGALVIGEALTSLKKDQVQPKLLLEYALELNWATAIRRLGSIADLLQVEFAKELIPIHKIKSNIDLEPRSTSRIWRDSKWWVKWPMSKEEFLSSIEQ